ncbi:MAG: hypothetical protein WAW23_09030 [Candidatus Methanoperedens sp.]
MPVIRNKLNQRIVVNLNGGKNIDLLAKGTADISERELSSPHLQTLIAKGDIIVNQKQAVAKETKITGNIKIRKMPRAP